jgi:uncharacterized membrane protein
MIAVWLKAVHISALVIWCGGVLVLPGLFALRPTVEAGPELWHLQRFTRRAYRAIVSPAAFVAVVSGTALVFVREVFTAWFAAKLAAVGVLTILHIRYGYIILHLFDEDVRYATWRKWLSILVALAAIGAILWLVLDKPPFGREPLPRWLVTPGGLREVVLPIIEPLLQSLPEIIRPIP